METLAHLFLGMFIGCYLIPTLVAVARDHRRAFAIFMLNVTAGWTVIGWLGALVWALRRAPEFGRGW